MQSNRRDAIQCAWCKTIPFTGRPVRCRRCILWFDCMGCCVMVNAIDGEALKLHLTAMEERFGLSSGLLVACLERPLTASGICYSRLDDFPPSAPAWLTRQRFAQEEFYRFDVQAFAALFEPSSIGHRAVMWLKACQSRSEHWLQRRDGQGGWVRLRHLGTLADLQRQMAQDQQRWDRYARQTGRLPRHPLQEEPGTATVMTFEDGWRWVKLLEQAAIVSEGHALRNCLREVRGVLVQRLQGGQLYSLRDAAQRSYELISVDEERVRAHAGACNAPPDPRHGPRVRALLNHLGVEASLEVDLYGRVDTEHGLIDLTRPGAATIPGSLLIHGSSGLTRLPHGLTIAGNLELRCASMLETIGHGIRVNGSVRLTHSPGLERIGRDLHVAGNLYVERCSHLKELGDGTQISGTVRIGGCERLMRLGQQSRIGGGLSIYRCARLRCLPLDISIGGRVNLSCSHVTAWNAALNMSNEVWPPGPEESQSEALSVAQEP